VPSALNKLLKVARFHGSMNCRHPLDPATGAVELPGYREARARISQSALAFPCRQSATACLSTKDRCELHKGRNGLKRRRSSLAERNAVKTGLTAGEAGSPVTAAVREAAVNVTNKYSSHTRRQHMSNFLLHGIGYSTWLSRR
jgi:hypothetical protein